MPPVTGEPEQEQLEWLSPQWIQVLKTACLGARERGMIADLLVGSGWPFGGKFLKPDQTIERMAVNYKDLEGPQELRISVRGAGKRSASSGLSQRFPGTALTTKIIVHPPGPQ
jgi:hypothetical protein